MEADRDERWRGWLRGIAHDAAIWLLAVAALGAYRVLLCAHFVEGARPSELARALWMGLRFDSVVATLVVSPSFALGLAWYLTGLAVPVARVRAYVVGAFFVVAPVFYAIDYGFFREFADHLNVRVMVAIEGATESLPETIWKSHQPLRLLAVAIAVAAIALWAVRRIARTPWTVHALERVRSRGARRVTVVAVLMAYVVLLRGISFGETPIRVRNAFVTPNAVLNRTIASPPATLLHALQDRRKERSVPADEAVRAAVAKVRTARGLTADTAEGDIFDNLTVRAGGNPNRPNHVFLVIMEGQHGFPLLPRYRETGLATALAALADRGAFVPSFVPAGASTDTSLAAIVAGLLLPDLVLSHEERALRPFATSLATTFRKLGYRTRFFYGGRLGWARLDLFLAGQGFEEVYGEPHVGREGNAWGVWDRDLYDFVLRSVPKDVPSLNVILTTTTHSPYDLPGKMRPQLSSLARAMAADVETLAIFEHEAYADRELGRFVEIAGRKLPQSLFALTGDHTAHAARPRYGSDASAAHAIVPMVFTGDALPPQLRGVVHGAGSHLDIAPTLYELCAPAGFVYSSFGENLFAGRRKSLNQGMIASEEQAVRTLSRAALHVRQVQR